MTVRMAAAERLRSVPRQGLKSGFAGVTACSEGQSSGPAAVRLAWYVPPANPMRCAQRLWRRRGAERKD